MVNDFSWTFRLDSCSSYCIRNLCDYDLSTGLECVNSLLIRLLPYCEVDRRKITYQAGGKVGRIANPSSLKGDGLAIRPTGTLLLAGRLIE